MDKESVFNSLNSMLEDSKAKPFLNHLVRSYFPIDKVLKVYEAPKEDFKCVLTKEKLTSIEEVLDNIQKQEFKSDFINSLRNIFDDGNEKSLKIVNKYLGDSKLGVCGRETTTYMSLESFQVFYEWVITQSLKDNKHINWLLNGVRRDSFLNRANNIKDVDVQRKLSSLQNNKKPHGTSFKLGDVNGILSELKNKIEKEEK